MRALLWMLGLFAVAVGLVIAARYNNGYVLAVLPHWRAELSLNLAIILVLGIFVVAYAAVRAVIIRRPCHPERGHSRNGVRRRAPGPHSMKR